MLHKGDRLRVQGVGTHLAQLHPDSPNGKAAQCYPVQLHLDNSIYYPNMLSEWKTLTKVSERALLLPTFHHSPMVCPDIFCHGFLKNSPQSLIALVIKKLSKHQNLTQFD